VEAARRAGLDEIEAIVEGVTDDDALIQALIENVQREDMEPGDIARSLKSLQETTGWSARQIAERGIMAARTTQRYLALSQEDPAVISLVSRPEGTNNLPDGSVGLRHIDTVREAGLDAPTRRTLLEKAASEGLTHQQTRRIAEAVIAAPSEEAKRVLLETEYSPVIHDPEMIKERAAKYGAHDPFYRDNTPSKQQQYDQTPEIRAAVDGVLEGAKRWNELIKVIRSMTEVGKLAPESRQFIAHRARQLAKTLTDWANELEAKE
jgi:ParB-like chromosome segregation protein Spo0J